MASVGWWAMITFTVSEFARRTDEILTELTEARDFAFITRHGRFIALVAPIDDAAIMKTVLSSGPISEEMRRRAAEDRPTYTSEQVLAMLDDEEA